MNTFSKLLSPGRVIAIASLAVALSTFFLSNVTGYGTHLSALVVLAGWNVIALLTSGHYADTHQFFLQLLDIPINMFLFTAPCVALGIVLRKKNPIIRNGAVLTWLVLYLCMLFFLFPMTDGP